MQVVSDLPTYDDAVELLADLRLQYHDELLDRATRAERDSNWYQVELALAALLRDDPTDATVATRRGEV